MSLISPLMPVPHHRILTDKRISGATYGVGQVTRCDTGVKGMFVLFAGGLTALSAQIGTYRAIK